MDLQLEKICRTCLAESKTLISIWTIENSPSKNTNSSLETFSLTSMLAALTTFNVSVILIVNIQISIMIYYFKGKELD